MRRLVLLGIIFVAVILLSSPALAWNARGKIFCDANQNGSIDSGDIPWGTAAIDVENLAATFFNTDPDTHSDGRYYLSLQDFPDTYTLCVDENRDLSRKLWKSVIST